MTIGPILPGRLPANLIASRLKANMQRLTQLLQNLNDQAATGQRFFVPSEDPADAIRAVSLQSILERKDQFQANLRTDKAFLAASEAQLSNVGDALISAQSLLLAGVGDNATSQEKVALANEVAGLIQSVLGSANATLHGRYLFGGSESKAEPFTDDGNGFIRYNGDRLSVDSYLDFDLQLANNIDGATAFNALAGPITSDANPAVTLDTKLSDLNGGSGIQKGIFTVTVDNGGPVTQTIDLAGADTVRDVKTLIENAFPPGTLTVDVIAPPGSSGLTITPSAGTVAIADKPGYTAARDLGIVSGPAASITGADIDPRLTLQTPLSAFNNGAGATTADGLHITNGQIDKTVDISSATTVEDLFNLLEAANVDLALGINDAGNGLSIASRLSGAAFGIGENGGTDATSLGIRTFTGGTLLSDLNFGRGVPVNVVDENGNPLPAEVEIVRRDGSTTTVDLQGLSTVQDVLDAITAVDANLSASLNAVGNGISITDTSGSGPLEVLPGQVADALGITGTEPGSNNAVPLVGQDVNQRQSTGVLSLLVQLERALRAGDDRALERLDPLFDDEVERFNLVRGEIGARQQTIERIENRTQDEDVNFKQQLSDVFDADLADVIARVTQATTSLQATLNIASSTLGLTLLNFL